MPSSFEPRKIISRNRPIDKEETQQIYSFFSGRTPVQFKEEEVPRAVDWSREHQGSPHLPLRIDSSGWVFSVTRSVETTLERNTGLFISHEIPFETDQYTGCSLL